MAYTYILRPANGTYYVGSTFSLKNRLQEHNAGADFYTKQHLPVELVYLETTRFHHEYKSQMELYLSWLDKHEREEGELPPLGLILCTEGSEEQTKYLEMDKTGIRVAHYYTELPEPSKLQEIIQQQLQRARE